MRDKNVLHHFGNAHFRRVRTDENTTRIKSKTNSHDTIAGNSFLNDVADSKFFLRMRKYFA